MFERYTPWPALRFVTEPPEPGTAPTPPVPTAPPEDLGFPADTTVEEMAPNEQIAYWKHKARKHEGRVKALGNVDQLKADSAELARLRAESQTDQEKALQQAREEARREGENLGASRYLADAIRADLRASTGKSNEDLAPVMGVIDTSKFVTADGDIDSEKLSQFAATFGIATSQQPMDPARAALARNRTTSAQTSVGSVNERRRQRREELSTKH